jgi:DNA repair protein RadA/Sms
MNSGLEEFDRVLGGGIVPGSVVLIGGDPGVGKSTLLLQVASRLVQQGRGVLYVSGEESAPQTKLRATRLGVSGELTVLAEADLERVLEAVGEGLEAPAADGSPAGEGRRAVEVLFVDSIQSAYLPGLPSAPGSMLQVREGALCLTQMAKRQGPAVLLVGHMTKEGSLAGPRTLEHIVDAVLTMEGEPFHAHRLLRSVKNRFGSVHEIGVFDMREDGLHEVTNPSQLFLGEEAGRRAGSAIVAGTEGTRALLIEVQALVHATRFGIPQRIATGFDGRRLAILLAVLLKRGGLDLSGSDVFVSVAGGLSLDEPGADLGVLLAISSSAKNLPAGGDLAAFGEVGLGGEVRRVGDPERRIGEAVRLGFKRVILPAASKRDLAARRWKPPEGAVLLPVATLDEAMKAALDAGGKAP